MGKQSVDLIKLLKDILNEQKRTQHTTPWHDRNKNTLEGNPISSTTLAVPMIRQDLQEDLQPTCTDTFSYQLVNKDPVVAPI